MFPLVGGMDDRALESTFVSFYDIYQTIATRSRFWLTSALVKIILLQADRFGSPVSHLFTRKLLANSGFDLSRTIASMGDEAPEHLIGGTGNKKWRVDLDGTVLDEIKKINTHYRMNYDDAPRYSPVTPCEPLLLHGLTNLDQAEIDGVTNALGRDMGASENPRADDGVSLECDLLIISPHKPSDRLSVVAIRFVNPKTFKTKGDIIEARLNLLQLKAFLAQQKPERFFDSINTWVCEIVDRNIDRGYPFFSSLTYRTPIQFWDEFMRVPFHLVREAIGDIGQGVLSRSLRDRLPH